MLRRIAGLASSALLVLGACTAAPDDVTVPDLVGQTVSTAKSEAEELGFTFDVIDDSDENRSVVVHENWLVVDLEPPPGKQVQHGTTLTAQVLKVDEVASQAVPSPTPTPTVAASSPSGTTEPDAITDEDWAEEWTTGRNLSDVSQTWNATIDGLGFGYRIQDMSSEVFDPDAGFVRHFRSLPGGELSVMTTARGTVVSVKVLGTVRAEGDMATFMATATAMAVSAGGLDMATADDLITQQLMKNGEIDPSNHNETVRRENLVYGAAVYEPSVEFYLEAWGPPTDEAT